MKQFPYEFELKKPVAFYPEIPTTGDILEIGPGRGDLLLSLARAQPTKKFIALEIGKQRYATIIRHVERLGLTNVSLICGDARVVLPRYFSENFFEKIIVLFPDPWPKDRHLFHRLLSIEFLWILSHQLKPGGELLFGTDSKPYAQWVIENLTSVTALSNALPSPFADNLPELPQTYFEKKWRAEKREIFFLKYRKL